MSDIKHGGEPITPSTPCNIYETLRADALEVNISFTDKTGTSPGIEQREGASCCEQRPPQVVSMSRPPHGDEIDSFKHMLIACRLYALCVANQSGGH